MHPAADLGLFASAVQDMDVDVEQPSIALQETHAIQSKQHPVNCAGKTINQLYAALQKTDSVYLLDADFKVLYS